MSATDLAVLALALVAPVLPALAVVVELSPGALLAGGVGLVIAALQWLATRAARSLDRSVDDHETRIRRLEERVARMEGPHAPGRSS